MTDKRELIRSKVFECSAFPGQEESWMRNTIILADGTSVMLEHKTPAPLEALIEEIYNIVGDDEDLYQFMLNEIQMHANAGDYNQRRKEALGWKPGMVLGTPDVPQEIVDEYTGVEFHCSNCDGED